MTKWSTRLIFQFASERFDVVEEDRLGFLGELNELVLKEVFLEKLEVKGDGVGRKFRDGDEAGVKKLGFPGLVSDVVDVLVKFASAKTFANGFAEENQVAGFLMGKAETVSMANWVGRSRTSSLMPRSLISSRPSRWGKSVGVVSSTALGSARGRWTRGGAWRVGSAVVGLASLVLVVGCELRRVRKGDWK